MDELIGGAIDSVAVLHSAAIEIRIDPPHASIFVDTLAMSRAVANLLENAHKHAPGKPIRISVSRKAERALLTVEDGGLGIAEPLRERVFQRFSRGDTRDSRGVGLGLSIVRAIVVAHEGTIKILDSEMGGARFEIELPQPSVEPELP